ncbi:unnamed protein product [Schistosoma mattheei]|uniref:Uncharacterized protein n=1 Tax=Schistosoma mattheei TaxID=31246 RepID=A0A183PIP1_9TREM|nr:unnamed protein product [Schistosoma mattheei]
MAFPNDSYISDKISYKSEENMLSEHNYDRKPEAVSIDANFSNDPLICNDIHNEFEDNTSENSSPHVIPNIICPQNLFDSSGKLLQ